MTNAFLLNHLAIIPSDRPVVSLMRHAEREAINSGSFGNNVPLTQYGESSTVELAQLLSARLIKIYSSPVKRCQQTAKYLALQARDREIIQHHFLGEPGIFIKNSDKVGPLFLQYSMKDIVQHLLDESSNEKGFCESTPIAVKQLVKFMFNVAIENGIYVFVTHDIILSVVLGYLFTSPSCEMLWPDYLESLFMWKTHTNEITINAQYRTWQVQLPC